MGELLQPLGVLTAIVYGVVIFVALRKSYQAIRKAIRSWYQRKWARIQAGINQILDHKDPEMEARIANGERKCS